MVRDSLLYKILHSKKTQNNCLQNLIHKFLHAGNGAGFHSLQDPAQQKTIVFKILSSSFCKPEMVQDSLLYKILHSKKQLFSKSYPQVSARRKWCGIPSFTRSCTAKNQTIVFKSSSTSFCTSEMVRDSLLYKILHSKKTQNNCLQNLIHKFLQAGNGAGFPSSQDPAQQKNTKQLSSKSYPQVSASRKWCGIPFFTRSCTAKKHKTIVFKILSTSFCKPEMVRDSLLYKILHSKKTQNNCLQNLIHKFLHAGNGAGFPSLLDPAQQKTIVFKILSSSFYTPEMMQDSLLYKILHSKKQLFSKSYPQVSARWKWCRIPFFTRS